MNSAVQPFNFLAGTEVLGASSEDWILDRVAPDGRERQFRARVTFQSSFCGTPLVHIGIAGFDISNQDAARLIAKVENISADGFDIVLDTWLGSRLWRVDVNWLALGA